MRTHIFTKDRSSHQSNGSPKEEEKKSIFKQERSQKVDLGELNFQSLGKQEVRKQEKPKADKVVIVSSESQQKQPSKKLSREELFAEQPKVEQLLTHTHDGNISVEIQ